MQFTTIVAALAAAGTSLAAPAPAGDRSMMSAGYWTIQDFKRTCPKTDSCHYNFDINLNNGKPTTHCAYDVTGHPAARATYQNVRCGDFTVGSTWSGQFGEGQGFQTLSVVKGKQIIYPAYTDNQLASGKVVKPDQSYTPQNLP